MAIEETIEQAIEIIYTDLREFLDEALPDNEKKKRAIAKLNQSRSLAELSILIDKE